MNTEKSFSLRLIVAVLGLATLSTVAGGADELDEGERIAMAMRLAPGMSVADVGAGYGQWSSVLLEYVSSTGSVFATEVDESAVAQLKRRFADDSNVRVVLGTDFETGLPDGCCDAILLRMVYHHFSEPEAMRRSLTKALRPGGRLVVVETQPEVSLQATMSCAEPEPWLDATETWQDDHEHNKPIDELIAEVSAGCFRVVEEIMTWTSDTSYGEGIDWNGGQAYAVVFKKDCGADSSLTP